jgi:aromatic ring-opening dioxygenase catalytic subunit (LigB family)
MKDAKLPTLFIPHGGGPWPFMPPPPGEIDIWEKLGAYLRSIPATLPTTPKAILVVSGHWETPRPAVNVNPAPPLLFDYYNFPERTYRLTYPAPGAPELGAHVRQLLDAVGIASDEEHSRGFDHGVFIPLMLIYPEADVPILQMSLQHKAPVETHLAIGRALAPLRDEGVLIVGSGMSYHNLREFFSPKEGARKAAAEFDAFLTEAVETKNPSSREMKLRDWRNAPGALASHPTAEHLEPLFVVAGAAGADASRRVFADEILGKAISGFQFG